MLQEEVQPRRHTVGSMPGTPDIESSLPSVDLWSNQSSGSRCVASRYPSGSVPLCQSVSRILCLADTLYLFHSLLVSLVSSLEGINRTQRLNIYSHADSLILSLSLSTWDQRNSRSWDWSSHIYSFSLSFCHTLTHAHIHSLPLVLVVMMESKEIKTKIYSRAHSLIFSLCHSVAQVVRSTHNNFAWQRDGNSTAWEEAEP